MGTKGFQILDMTKTLKKDSFETGQEVFATLISGLLQNIPRLDILECFRRDIFIFNLYLIQVKVYSSNFHKVWGRLILFFFRIIIFICN